MVTHCICFTDDQKGPSLKSMWRVLFWNIPLGDSDMERTISWWNSVFIASESPGWHGGSHLIVFSPWQVLQYWQYSSCNVLLYSLFYLLLFLHTVRGVALMLGSRLLLVHRRTSNFFLIVCNIASPNSGDLWTPLSGDDEAVLARWSKGRPSIHYILTILAYSTHRPCCITYR